MTHLDPMHEKKHTDTNEYFTHAAELGGETLPSCHMQTRTNIKIILQYNQLTKHFNILGSICSNLQLHSDWPIQIIIVYMETADLIQENLKIKKKFK